MNKSVETIVSQLGNFYSYIDYNSIPSEVKLKARRVLIDFLATLAVGIQRGPLTTVLTKYFFGVGGVGKSTVLGFDKKIPVANAALLMGAIAHSVELDDGHRFGTCHPAVAVIPAALAVGEFYKRSFKDIIAAIIKGYDVMLRIARSINPSHLSRGFHTTGTAGVFGSATAAAHLLNMNSCNIAYCLSLAGLQSCGLQEMLHDHPSIKVIQSGRAAYTGVMSAELIILGAKSPRTLFEGEHGWLRAMTDQFYKEALLGKLGDRWEIMNTYTKLYPTCRHCHPAIDLAIAFREQQEIDLNKILEINVNTYQVALSEVTDKTVPVNFEEALFSMPFSIALALRDGDVGLHSFTDENFNDEILIKLAKKVKVSLDEEINSRYPFQRGAILKIVLDDGSTVEQKTILPKGEPELPLTDVELFNKIKKITTPFYRKAFSEHLWEIVVDLDVDKVDYRDIIRLFLEETK